MDFTIKQYKLLLNVLVKHGYSFQTFAQYFKEQENAQLTTHNSLRVILRHDVEARYERALKFAEIQHALGIRGTYYFRILPGSFRPEIVRKIAELGHEIGYHYDDLAVCKGDFEKAIARFQKNLKTLRDIAPVETICMDGSPLSSYDNKDLWRLGDKETERLGDWETERLGEKETEGLGDKETERGSDTSASSRLRFDFAQRKRSMSALSVKGAEGLTNQTYYAYQDFGIIGEPYFDLDFNKVFYLTDTGRMWDGDRFNVRDRVGASAPLSARAQSALRFHSTKDIIQAIEKGEFPEQSMITFHPQRWTDGVLPWVKEFVLQNAKNQIKRFLVKK